MTLLRTRMPAPRACLLSALGLWAVHAGAASDPSAAHSSAQAAAIPAGPGPCVAERPALLVERFISADCRSCWEAAPPMPSTERPVEGAAIALDWIVPGPGGDAGPLAAAALPEAVARAAGVAGGAVGSDETLTRTFPLPRRTALRVDVEDGPASNGYIGVRMSVRYDARRPLPEGLVGWLALVERIAAGTEGSPVDRQLVRALVGPLAVSELSEGRAVQHLRAVRLPKTGNPELLAAVGWVETPGRILAVGARRNPHCTPRP